MNKEKIKIWILNNLLSILKLVVPSIVSVGSIVACRILELLTWIEFFLLMALIIVFILIGVKMLWNSLSYKSYHYPWSKINTAYNYIVLEKNIVYKREKDDTLQYSREMIIQGCSNRVDYAYDKYIWTGVQANNIKIKPIKGIANIKHKSRIGIWNYFVMELNNHMEKGDVRELLYKWPDVQQCTKSSPFFSTSTDEPTKKIVLLLDLGEEYAEQEIVCEEFRAIESDYPIYVKRDRLDERGVYKWEIPSYKVKRFRHYRIRWSWNKGQPAAEIVKEE